MEKRIKKNEINYPAPALAKGIIAMRALQDEGPMVLERLSKTTGVPKASMLRMMETLAMLDMVKRDPETKAFHLMVGMLPHETGVQHLRRQIKPILKKLSAQVRQTVEWYEPESTLMIITERHEPSDKPVRVLARIGYARELDSEMESVSRLALASGYGDPQNASYWNYKQGKRIPMSPEAVKKSILEAKDEQVTFDYEYNSHGVRRFAATILNVENRLIGILAIAESFHPGADEEIESNLAALKNVKQTLETNLKNFGILNK